MIFVDATLDPSRFDASPQRLAMLEGAIGELGRAFQRFGRGLRKRRRRAGDRNGLTAASPAAERAVRERAGHAEEPDGGQGDGLQAVDSGGGAERSMPRTSTPQTRVRHYQVYTGIR